MVLGLLMESTILTTTTTTAARTKIIKRAKGHSNLNQKTI